MKPRRLPNGHQIPKKQRKWLIRDRKAQIKFWAEMEALNDQLRRRPADRPV